MIGASFEFLKEKFPLIYYDCERMEKNLVEGDGIESIMLSGRVCERIAKTIFEIESLDYIESQFKRIQKLDSLNILPKDIKDKFNQVRTLRNDVYHRDVAKALNPKNTFTRTYSSKSTGSSTKSYSTNSSSAATTKNYESNKSKTTRSIGELDSARQAHKLVFNITVWFFEEYGEDKSFYRPFYKVGKRSKDTDILIRLKHALEDEDEFKEILIATRKDNKITELLKELRGLNAKSKKDSKPSNQVYKDNKKIRIRKPDKPYSECIGISYDDELFMWKADYDGKELGLFNTSKEAYEARQVFLNSIPVPKLKSNGKYSTHIGISFSKINKMWTVSVKGKIIGYYGSEKSALKMRNSYYKKHGIKIKYKNDDEKNSFTEKDTLIDNLESSLSISTSTKSKKSSKTKKSKSKLDYAKEFKNEKKSVKDEKKKSVKVKEGKRVSKPLKKAKKTVKINRKASKYEGIYYEDALFMWSAEVDGKELGLFTSEEEAKAKRDAYIKNMKK